MAFFPRGEGGGQEIEYGFKGKGTTTHLLVDGNGLPIAFTSTAANGDERQQVEPLLDRLEKHINKVLATDVIPVFEADKGYDAIVHILSHQWLNSLPFLIFQIARVGFPFWLFHSVISFSI